MEVRVLSPAHELFTSYPQNFVYAAIDNNLMRATVILDCRYEKFVTVSFTYEYNDDNPKTRTLGYGQWNDKPIHGNARE